MKLLLAPVARCTKMGQHCTSLNHMCSKALDHFYTNQSLNNWHQICCVGGHSYSGKGACADKTVGSGAFFVLEQRMQSHAPQNTHSTCPYCGVGCGVVSNKGSATIAGDLLHPANFGRLCVKGTALAETLNTQGRLLQPVVDGMPADWPLALTTASPRRLSRRAVPFVPRDQSRETPAIPSPAGTSPTSLSCATLRRPC